MQYFTDVSVAEEQFRQDASTTDAANDSRLTTELEHKFAETTVPHCPNCENLAAVTHRCLVD